MSENLIILNWKHVCSDIRFVLCWIIATVSDMVVICYLVLPVGFNTLVSDFVSGPAGGGLIHWYSGDIQSVRKIEQYTLKILFENVFYTLL